MLISRTSIMRCIVVKWLYLQHSHMQSPSLGESPLLAKCEFSKPAADDGVCRMFNDLTAFMRCINGKHVRAPHNQLFYFWDIPTTRCINAFIRLLWLCDDEVNRSVLYTLKRFHYAWSFRYGSSTRNKTTPSFQPPYDVVYHVWLCVLYDHGFGYTKRYTLNFRFPNRGGLETKSEPVLCALVDL